MKMVKLTGVKAEEFRLIMGFDYEVKVAWVEIPENRKDPGELVIQWSNGQKYYKDRATERIIIEGLLDIILKY